MNRTAVAILLTSIVQVNLTAAEPARDLAQMLVMPDAIVYVRTASGADIQGRFVRASSQTLVVNGLDGRELTLMVDEVIFVWKRGDSLRNGAIIGALIGVAGAIGGQSTCSDCSAEVAAGVFLGAPIWAGIGALVDRQHVGRTLIYRAP